MLQESKNIRKKSETPKPDKNRNISFRVIANIWKICKWLIKKLHYFFMLFIGFFIDRFTYLFEALGIGITLSYWFSFTIALILPLSLLIILISYGVQWYQKYRGKSHIQENSTTMH